MKILIRYFQERLCLSIEAHLDNPRCDLVIWEKVIEKAIDIEAKASLQPFCKTRKIDSSCFKGYSKANWMYWDGNKDKAKPHNLSLANTNQS